MWSTSVINSETIHQILNKIIKLIKMPGSSLLNTCYTMQVSFDKIYQKGWVTDFKKLLFSDGFGHVSISQGVGDEELFL